MISDRYRGIPYIHYNAVMGNLIILALANEGDRVLSIIRVYILNILYRMRRQALSVEI